MLQHWAHSRNRPTATDEKTRKTFSISVVISPVGTISGKSLKLLPPDVIFKKAKMHQIQLRLGNMIGHELVIYDWVDGNMRNVSEMTYFVSSGT